MLFPRIQRADVNKALKYEPYFEPMMKNFNELKQTTNLLESLVT